MNESAATDTTHLRYGSRTDVGCVRAHNEDSLIARPPFFAIADGMGGHEAGEVASEIAVETLARYDLSSADVATLSTAIIAANRAILRGAREGVGRQGMGTTLTAAIIEDDDLLIAQVGDSRAYLLHGGRLQQITHDHSLVEELVAMGEITPDEALTHPNRSVITRALGSDFDTRPDYYELAIQPGDRLMLCSDGLSGMVGITKMEHILKTKGDPQLAADTLVEAARDAGGYDNITTIVVDVGSSKSQQQPRRQRFKLSVIAFILVFAILIAGAVGGLYSYAHNAAFLIAQDGYVNVYRGLPGEVLGIRLQWHEYSTAVRADALAPTTTQRLQEGIRVGSLDEAKALVAQYQEQTAPKLPAPATTQQQSASSLQGANLE
ncbi:MAG: Stp1/IreP family PP2C-type Ser/Thr phosphatase [Coriobacteriales bacterium]|jgi:protein phosphatase|nr:Stp1/IreP family PP2C-type Ser/Thr phosphatase [Coriobacteriales bacterium]